MFCEVYLSELYYVCINIYIMNCRKLNIHANNNRLLDMSDLVSVAGHSLVYGHIINPGYKWTKDSNCHCWISQ